MNQYLLMKIKEEPKYYNYLKENSFWIKNFNRNQNLYKEYVNFLKNKYRLRVTDKLSDAVDSIDLVTNVLNTLK